MSKNQNILRVHINEIYRYIYSVLGELDTVVEARGLTLFFLLLETTKSVQSSMYTNSKNEQLNDHQDRHSIEMTENVDFNDTSGGGDVLVERLSLVGSTDKTAKPPHTHADSHGLEPGSASNTQVAFNIFTSFVGAGMLGMPFAFKQSGWILGSIALSVTSTANVYAMLLLVKVRQQLECEGHVGIHGYGDVGRIILGPIGEKAVNVCLVISQVGFATAYIIFVAANLYSIAETPTAYACIGCIPILAILVQARDIKTLSPFSFLATVASLAGLSAVFLQDFEGYVRHQDSVRTFDWNNLVYVFSISVYSLEGVSLILPLETSCQNRHHFPLLIKSVLCFVTLLMITFGTAGYLAFGEQTSAPITLNLVGDGWATFVKLALCFALYFTYPIMMFPVHGVMEGLWSALGQQARVPFRVMLVVLTALIAYAIPDFGKFLSLVGSSICTVLGFIFPCSFHLAVFGRKGLEWWEIVLDVLLMVVGFMFGALGTYDSFCNIFLHT
jgi:solute carrier family 36 (proton-coupled amino acid transporter)